MLGKIRSIRDRILYQVYCTLKGEHYADIKVPFRTFSDPDYHIFIGYYDVKAFNAAETLMIAGRCPSAHNGRAMDYPLEIGFYTLETGAFTKIADTALWCWQQGCRLQWVNWRGAEALMYNDLLDGAPHTIIFDPYSIQRIATLPFATYALNHDGRLAATLDFDYLERCRKGYGYDWNDALPLTLDRAAIEIFDTVTLERTARVSLQDILAVHPHPSMLEEGVGHYFNHLHFNDAGTRLMIFHIWNENRGKRSIRALTMNVDGTDIRDVTLGTHISHYWWMSDDEILIYGTDPAAGLGFHVYRQDGGTLRTLDKNIPRIDGHPSRNPVNPDWLVSDSVVNRRFERDLWLYDLQDEVRIDIAHFRSLRFFSGAIRCDLHPRWSSKANFIAVDSAHNGRREIVLLDVSDIIKPELD